MHGTLTSRPGEISPMQIFKQFTFDSAHFLPNVPEGHKCREIHGHTYKLIIYLEGKPGSQTGWILDFGSIRNAVDPLIKMVDHKLLNGVAGLENPTCELIAAWFWKHLKPTLPNLSKIELFETPTSGVIYQGEPF
jgi:6-pyruvoyltetrahydropterin/6-carboxytetrahydropterin synthase